MSASFICGRPVAHQVIVNRMRYLVEQMDEATMQVGMALKGPTTPIASPEGDFWCQVSGNAGLGASGSSDVLAGSMTGLAARGVPLVQAAAWGVALHALAGRRLAKRQGRAGFPAREILREIPSAMPAM